MARRKTRVGDLSPEAQERIQRLALRRLAEIEQALALFQANKQSFMDRTEALYGDIQKRKRTKIP